MRRTSKKKKLSLSLSRAAHLVQVQEARGEDAVVQQAAHRLLGPGDGVEDVAVGAHGGEERVAEKEGRDGRGRG